ncbi:MAG: radical SAM protein [Methanobacteriaceae archaeon]|nr:radical SAM protein [Methanobacteriaceae archaeon]
MQQYKKIKDSLSHYFQVMSNKKLSKSKVSSKIKTVYSDDIDQLWIEHENIRNQFNDLYEGLAHKNLENPDYTFLDLKIEIAEKIIENCHLCERRCNINRYLSKGECGVKESRIASQLIHTGEERVLVPSHTIFFSGCNFQCVFCQNFDISQNPLTGVQTSPENLAEIIDKNRKHGSRNVNFVGGDPTPNLPFILKTMNLVNENIPVVWNSNFYMSLETMKLLDGFVDLYLTDFKYGNDKCAKRLSKINNYWEVAKRNHKMAEKNGDLIIRHLVLPGHLECCTKPLLEWISQNLKKDTVINIMGQYRPIYLAENYEELGRYVYLAEISEAVKYAKSLGLKNVIH